MITVNKGKNVIIDGGTVSDYIYMELDYPCSLNLIIKSTSIGSFSLLPSTIALSRGAKKASFRIAVP